MPLQLTGEHTHFDVTAGATRPDYPAQEGDKDNKGIVAAPLRTVSISNVAPKEPNYISNSKLPYSSVPLALSEGLLVEKATVQVAAAQTQA